MNRARWLPSVSGGKGRPLISAKRSRSLRFTLPNNTETRCDASTTSPRRASPRRCWSGVASRCSNGRPASRRWSGRTRKRPGGLYPRGAGGARVALKRLDRPCEAPCLPHSSPVGTREGCIAPAVIISSWWRRNFQLNRSSEVTYSCDYLRSLRSTPPPRISTASMYVRRMLPVTTDLACCCCATRSTAVR